MQNAQAEIDRSELAGVTTLSPEQNQALSHVANDNLEQLSPEMRSEMARIARGLVANRHGIYSYEEDPPHVSVIKEVNTSPFWRLFLSTIMIRYLGRATVGAIAKKRIELQEYAIDKEVGLAQEKLMDEVEALTKELAESGTEFDMENPKHKALVERLQKVQGAHGVYPDKQNPGQYIHVEGVNFEPRAMFNTLRDGRIAREERLKLKPFGENSGTLTRNKANAEYLEFLEKRDPLSKKVSDADWLRRQLRKTITEESYKARNSKIQHFWNLVLDAGAGIVSLGTTAYYGNQVLQNMKSVFAETVGYELGKDPSDVTLMDLFRSENKIVKETIQRWRNLNLARLATDAVYFFRIPLSVSKSATKAVKDIPGIDLGMGTKGLFLTVDTLSRKQTTIFQDITEISDKKINPITGLGSEVSAHDLIDLYQKFAMENHPDGAFRNPSAMTPEDRIAWRQGKFLFDRMAMLMNNTYKYAIPQEAGFGPYDREEAFGMPEYLYLLGNDLIDLRNPKLTSTYIEVANKYGIKAVKTIKEGISKGALLDYYLDSLYPVDIMKGAPEGRDKEIPLPLVKNASENMRTNYSEKLSNEVGNEPLVTH